VLPGETSRHKPASLGCTVVFLALFMTFPCLGKVPREELLVQRRAGGGAAWVQFDVVFCVPGERAIGLIMAVTSGSRSMVCAGFGIGAVVTVALFGGDRVCVWP
jgi:hypothetical protein